MEDGIKLRARNTLSGKWSRFVGYTLLIILITTIIDQQIAIYFPNQQVEEKWLKYILIGIGWSNLISFTYGMLVSGILSFGEIRLYTTATTNEQSYSIKDIFYYFTKPSLYFKAFKLNLLNYIFTTLWSLLLIVPGIIKSYSYRMAPYLLVDEPHLTANEAITKSRKMMDGYKLKLFYLHLSFIGWFLLCILSLGIGLLWLLPYFSASEAHFYHEIKQKNKELL